MQFHQAHASTLDCIAQRNRGMGISAGIQYHPQRFTSGLRSTGLVQPINQHAFVIALTKIDRQIMGSSGLQTQLFDIGQTMCAIDSRFTFDEEIQVGTVEDEDFFHGNCSGWMVLPVRAASMTASVAARLRAASTTVTSGLSWPRTTAQKCTNCCAIGSFCCSANCVQTNGVHQLAACA